MTMTLFDEFIHDGGLSTCQDILDAIQSRRPERVISELNSNCFDVTIHYENRFALLEDVLDISPGRQQRFPLDEFIVLITRAAAGLKARERR